MNFLKWLFILVLISVTLIIIGLIVFIKTFDANKYKPQITQEIAKALGREVSVGDIALNLSLGQKITLAVKDLTIADDPQFAKENFLETKRIDLGIDVSQFLAKRQILVSSIELQSPTLTIIRDKDGKLNVLSLANQQASAESAGDSSGTSADHSSDNPPTASTDEKTPLAMPELLVKQLTLKDGQVKIVDQSFSPAIVIETKSFSLRVDDFSLDKPFSFSAKTALWNNSENISLSGNVALDMAKGDAKLSNVVLESDLSKISLEQLRNSLAAFEALKLIKSLQGEFKTEIKQAEVGSKGIVDLLLEGTLANAKVEIEGLSTAIESNQISFNIRESDIDIPKTTLLIGSGKVIVNGKVTDYLQSQKFEFNKIVEDVQLGEVFAQKDQANQILGKISAEYQVAGAGFKYPELLDSIKADGKMEIKDGKLTNINILKVVLDKISMIPNLSESVKTKLPDKYKEKLKVNDTALNKVILNSNMRDGVFVVDNIDVETDAFLMSGQGQITMDYDLSLNASIFIPQDLSESMAASQEGLKYLLDESGRIFIPVTVQGKIPALTFLPDLEYLGKKIFVNQGTQQLEKVINKALGIEEKPETAPVDGQPVDANQPAQEPENPSPEKQLIEGILNGIFK